jgi:hypothetical protein
VRHFTLEADMSVLHRLLWKTRALVFPILLAGLSCTQQNPVSPTASINRIVLLASLKAVPTQILTGGQKSQVLAQVIDDNGAPVANQIVSFYANSLCAVNPSRDTTDAGGTARTLLISTSATGTAVVTAKLGSFTKTVDVDVVSTTDTSGSSGFILTFTAKRSEAIANGSDAVELEVQLTSTGSKSPVGQMVRLSTTPGTVLSASTVLCASTGLATATVVSQPGEADITATVTAVFGNQTAQVQVRFKGVRFTVEAPDTADADGNSTNRVRAQLRETTTNIAIPDQEISFSASLGSIQASQTTDEYGIADVQLVSGTVSGHAVITARYGTLVKKDTTVFIQPRFTVDVDGVSRSVLGDGMDTAMVRIRLKDSKHLPLGGVPVFVSSDIGSVNYAGITDASGNLVAVFTGPTLANNADNQTASLDITVTVQGSTKKVTVPIVCKGLELSLSADPEFILADGTSQSAITARLREKATQTGIAAAAIQFGATNNGTLTASRTTDEQGIARVSLTSSRDTGPSVVTARYGTALSVSKTVQFIQSRSLVMQPMAISPRYILANGSDQAMISLKVVDSGGIPAESVPVQFSCTAGSITAQDVTDANGVVTVPVVSVESAYDKRSRITARFGSALFGDQVVEDSLLFEGIQLKLSAASDTLVADGRSTDAVTVELKRRTSHIAVGNAAIVFSATLGSIPNSAVTGLEGLAQVSLTSGTSPGTSMIKAFHGPNGVIRDSAVVVFQRSVPGYIEASAIPPVLPADGQSQSTIKASVFDGSHHPVPDGTPVSFSLISGSGTLDQRKTTVSGVATTLLTASNTQGIAQVFILAGKLPDTVSAKVQVTYTVGSVSQVLLTTTPYVISELPADGHTTTTFKATVTDAQGNRVNGSPVYFTASIGDITPTTITDSRGEATATFSSGVVGTATITATVPKTDGTNAQAVFILKLTPGVANSILLRVSSNVIVVKNTGQNQTATIFADVKDAKNNPVKDNTLVRFRFLNDSLGCVFSSYERIPTVGGTAQISLSSGIRSGTVRVKADVTNDLGQLITSTFDQIIVQAGPPYMSSTTYTNYEEFQHQTRLNIESGKLNVFKAETEKVLSDTTLIRVTVSDRYGNPAERVTVYFNTSGGAVSTHEALTNEYGIATVRFDASGNPPPSISEFYGGIYMLDPNRLSSDPLARITGPVLWKDGNWRLPNFDLDPTTNDYDDVGGFYGNANGENEGIAKVMAYTVGQDAADPPQSVKVWNYQTMVLSGYVGVNRENGGNAYPPVPRSVLGIGQSTNFLFSLMDRNGNPIEAYTAITATIVPSGAPAGISWNVINTGAGWGQDYYWITISNTVSQPDTSKPDVSAAVHLHFQAGHQFGDFDTQTVTIRQH